MTLQFQGQTVGLMRLTRCQGIQFYFDFEATKNTIFCVGSQYYLFDNSICFSNEFCGARAICHLSLTNAVMLLSSRLVAFIFAKIAIKFSNIVSSIGTGFIFFT